MASLSTSITDSMISIEGAIYCMEGFDLSPLIQKENSNPQQVFDVISLSFQKDHMLETHQDGKTAGLVIWCDDTRPRAYAFIDTSSLVSKNVPDSSTK